MKKTFSVVLVLAMLLSCLALFSCTPNKEDDKEETTRMTIDINPSVEFMLDKEHKVASVTALNDDGAVLIAGEVFLGLSAEEAGELFVNIAKETGYLVEGTSNGNEVEFSISGDSSHAENLKASVKGAIESKLNELNINGAVDELEELALDALREMVLEATEYTEEEVDKMSKEELYSALKLARIDSALLLTEELRSAYYHAKEYEISFAERKEAARVIDEISAVHAMLNTAYKTALEAYQAGLVKLEEYRYDNLVDPESSYQKALLELREKKAHLIEQRNIIAGMDEMSSEYASEVNKLDALEAQYTAALNALEALGEAVSTAIDALLVELKALEAALIELESNFSADIKAELEAKASEIEAKVNLVKDNFFASFEEEHKDDIERIENELLARKQALIEANLSTAE